MTSKEYKEFRHQKRLQSGYYETGKPLFIDKYLYPILTYNHIRPILILIVICVATIFVFMAS